jgi:hypothetical protein
MRDAGRRRCDRLHAFADREALGDLGVRPELDSAASCWAERAAVDLPPITVERDALNRFRFVSDYVSDARNQTGQLVAVERTARLEAQDIIKIRNLVDVDVAPVDQIALGALGPRVQDRACAVKDAKRKFAVGVVAFSIVRLATVQRRPHGHPLLSGESLDRLSERHAIDMPHERNSVPALATSATIPKLLFDVYAEAILAAADRARADVFAARPSQPRAEVSGHAEDVGPSGSLDPLAPLFPPLVARVRAYAALGHQGCLQLLTVAGLMADSVARVTRFSRHADGLPENGIERPTCRGFARR